MITIFLLSSSISAATNNVKLEGCLNQGKIENGLVVSAAEEIKPRNGLCPKYTVVLEPGTILNNRVVNSLGICIDKGVVLAGFGSTVSGGLIPVGSKLSFSEKKCSNKGDSGLFISANVTLDVLNSTNQVFVVQENPLIGNSSFRTITIRDTVCLASGTIIDGLLKATSFDLSNAGKCPETTAMISKGVINSLTNQPFSPNNQCLIKGVLNAGRVLFGSVIHLNRTLSSGILLKNVFICNHIR